MYGDEPRHIRHVALEPAPLTLLYVPAEHGVHSKLPSARYVPGLQAIQLRPFALFTYPAGQYTGGEFTHSVPDPGAFIFQAGHGTQLEIFDWPING